MLGAAVMLTELIPQLNILSDKKLDKISIHHSRSRSSEVMLNQTNTLSGAKVPS